MVVTRSSEDLYEKTRQVFLGKILTRAITMTKLSLIVLLWLCLGDVSIVIANETQVAQQSDKTWVFLENDHLRVGLLKSHGGALGYLSVKGMNDNVIDHYDHGRLIQQSYYGDADESHWVKKEWCFNPVQGGDYKGNAAVVLVFESSKLEAYVKTIPRHWASGVLLNECVMEQWVSLQGPLVQISFKFTYSGMDAHQPRHQELPAVFVAAKYSKLVAYTGDMPWLKDKPSEYFPGYPNEYLKITENWVAYVNDADEGLGVYVPIAFEATCYRFRGGSGSDCSYVAPIKTFSITPGFSFSYDAYFTMGNTSIMRQRFYELHETR